MIFFTATMRAAQYFASLAKGATMDAAEVIERNSEGGVMKAALALDSGSRIVCQRVDFASWEPLYVENGDTRSALPSCFNLNNEAIATLEASCQ